MKICIIKHERLGAHHNLGGLKVRRADKGGEGNQSVRQAETCRSIQSGTFVI